MSKEETLVQCNLLIKMISPQLHLEYCFKLGRFFFSLKETMSCLLTTSLFAQTQNTVTPILKSVVLQNKIHSCIFPFCLSTVYDITLVPLSLAPQWIRLTHIMVCRCYGGKGALADFVAAVYTAAVKMDQQWIDWKITLQSVGGSWVYSKNLVTFNMLSMNLSHCLSNNLWKTTV